MKRFFTIINISFLLFSGYSHALDITISAEVEVSIQRTQAQGNELLLWLPSEVGILEQERALAASLAAAGIEVWYADLLSAYFLPTVASSVEQIPAQDIVRLLVEIEKRTDKKIIMIANGRGAMLALRIARLWQQQFPGNKKLGGTILLSPKLFVETPEPGLAGHLLPITYKTNLPMYIIQPENSPWRWKLDRTLPALESGGSDVYARLLAGVRDRFYFRPDANSVEDRMAEKLSDLILHANRSLRSYQHKRRLASSAKDLKLKTISSGKKERLLRAYSGNPNPEKLILKNMNDATVDLAQFKGRVVLVNFWATWCPPCVHEMPSMQKLSEHFSTQPFEILAVNMAEDKQTINTFLREKVTINFPVLLDSDGQALKRWNVFAFPTSYVIGKKGKIRLALFGSIDWMKQDVIDKINMLVKE